MIVTVVVADDDDVVRSSLCAAVDADDRLRLVGQAADGAAALDEVTRTRPDVVVLDVRMPGSGVSAAQRVHELDPSITVVVVSARLDPLAVARLLRAGVRGLFLKGRIGADLGDLLLRCRAGEVLVAAPTAAEGLRLLAAGADGP